MNTILYVAKLIQDGNLELEGATTVETERTAVYSKNGREYIDEYYIDSERLGPHRYEVELEELTYTVEEIQDYIDGPFAAELAEYEEERREATARIAELVEQVTPLMNELLGLANHYNIPANIKVGAYTNDFRLIDAVDWNSSSMYC